MKRMAKEIAELQHIMLAESKKALLIVFQGMDASGKDGATSNVFKYCSPSGIRAFGFKKPTDEEFAHDFLWRVHKLAPAKGQIVIFNRSHYEDILIQRVHKWIDEDRVTARINAINAWEQTLVTDNNTTILKFYLHISPERQKEKLQERIDIAEKNWKHNPGDWEEREHWESYMKCYEEAINRCNLIPWDVVPVDQRWHRNYVVAQKVLETMKAMSFEYPKLKNV
jgi:PPK2 family polyphosphate:nucleotide phosphotransferase